MKPNPGVAAILFAALCLLVPAINLAQSNPGVSAPHRETTQDLIAKLNPQQKQQFDDAGKAYREHRFADSFAIHRLLLKDFPGDPILLKFAGETAIQSGDSAFAVNMLKPLAQADPDDWQAAALLTRACAETGDKSGRDAGMAHMLDLHSRGITPPQMQQYAVESVKLGENTLLINTSLVPWGYYKVYALGKVSDSAGTVFLSISVESSDFDQPEFAKEHPDEAAKGMRLFSLDAYRETGLNSNGQRTQTHYTYKFFEGQPSYETIRVEFISIASGKSTPISSRSGLIVR
jgi:hypothetical protein